MSFLGFYYKLNDPKSNTRLIIVAGYHKRNNFKQGFIQFSYFDSNSAKFKTETIYDEVKSFKNNLVKIGSSEFSNNHILIKTENIHLAIELHSIIPYPKNKISKNIMGVMGLVPFVECKHHVHSIHSEASGTLQIKSEFITLNKSQVYIESSYGKQFPESFFWTHFNQFENNPNTHFLLACANPKWLFTKRSVYIGYLITNQEFYSFGNYQQFKLVTSNNSEKSFEFHFKSKSSQIQVNINLGTPYIELIGPEKYGMSRKVKEFTDSTAEIIINKNSKDHFFLSGRRGTTENETVKKNSHLSP